MTHQTLTAGFPTERDITARDIIADAVSQCWETDDSVCLREQTALADVIIRRLEDAG